ncbi:MAG: hypothetical protein JSS69_06820 [Acidobacteria bacterium]|nr:hypothetical protein [Acidobacteriota bacterium]MBS1865616.1 hypothetical protein [Acidobacteriota bacterium]
MSLGEDRSSATFAKAGSGRQEKSAGGGAAGVEIIGFPQILFTRTFGDPDMLFVPLLDAGREAFAMIERLVSHGEKRENAVKLSGMQLASSLLQDSSFSLVARGLSHENSYTVDLENGTLLVQTRLFAVVSRRTSFFKVEIVGKFGEMFVVRNPSQNTVIMQVEEERLRQPNFFSTTLAQECLRAQMGQERFGRVEDAVTGQFHQEVRMVVPVSGNRIPIVLRQKEDGGTWDIVDDRKQEWVGTLEAGQEGPLRSLIESVKELFDRK